MNSFGVRSMGGASDSVGARPSEAAAASEAPGAEPGAEAAAAPGPGAAAVEPGMSPVASGAAAAELGVAATGALEAGAVGRRYSQRPSGPPSRPQPLSR